MTVKKYYRFWSRHRSFRSQTNPCGICGRPRGIRIGFCPGTSVFHCIIPPIFSTHISLTTTNAV